MSRDAAAERPRTSESMGRVGGNGGAGSIRIRETQQPTDRQPDPVAVAVPPRCPYCSCPDCSYPYCSCPCRPCRLCPRWSCPPWPGRSSGPLARPAAGHRTTSGRSMGWSVSCYCRRNPRRATRSGPDPHTGSWLAKNANAPAGHFHGLRERPRLRHGSRPRACRLPGPERSDYENDPTGTRERSQSNCPG